MKQNKIKIIIICGVFFFSSMILQCSDRLVKAGLSDVETTVNLFNEYLNAVDDIEMFAKIKSITIDKAYEDFLYIYELFINEEEQSDKVKMEIEFLKSLYKNLYIFVKEKKYPTEDECQVTSYYYNKKLNYHTITTILLKKQNDNWYISDFKY